MIIKYVSCRDWKAEPVLAVQWRRKNLDELKTFCGDCLVFATNGEKLPRHYNTLWLKISDRTVIIQPSDWIVNVDAGFVPYRNAVFASDYRLYADFGPYRDDDVVNGRL